MKNLDTIDKLINMLGNPIAFFFTLATFLSSLCILLAGFLPYSFLKRMHYIDIYDKYGGTIFIIAIVSLFFVIIQSGMRYEKIKRDKEFRENFIKQQNNLLKDPDAIPILSYLYETHPNARWLPYNNQKVQLLEQFGLITKTMNTIYTDDVNNPLFPYILQPKAEEKIKEIVNNKK